MKRISFLSLFFILTPIFSGGLICLSQQKVPSPIKDISVIEYDLFKLVNKEREKLGLPLLIFSEDLSLLARKHSQGMAASQELSHLSSSGKTYSNRLVDAGFYFIASGENTAFSETFVAEFIHQPFMESPDHRENILDLTYDRVGIGIAFAEKKGYYITMDFLNILEPKEEEVVQKEIREEINDLRLKNSLPPLQFIELGDEFARVFSLRKAERRIPPPIPTFLGQNNIVFTSTPSLHEAYNAYKDMAANPIYTKASLSVVFKRNIEYQGGAYFITLILFPGSKQNSWNKSQEYPNGAFWVAILLEE